MKTEYFGCVCFGTDCLLAVTVDGDPSEYDENIIWVEMAVKRGPFLYRLKQALKFIFTKNKPWYFHDMMIQNKDIKRLQETVNKAVGVLDERKAKARSSSERTK